MALPKYTKPPEGIKVDTLFLNGVMDGDTYYRYLRDYAKQIRRHGVAHRAVGTMKDGVLGYRFTKKKEFSGGAVGERPHYYSDRDQREYIPDGGNVCYWAEGLAFMKGKICRIAKSHPWEIRVRAYAEAQKQRHLDSSAELLLDTHCRNLEEAE